MNTISNYEDMPGKDRHLWMQAKKRVGFKAHLWSYIIIIGFLWLLWYILMPPSARSIWTAWPIWPTMGWGIGLAFHFVFTYIISDDKYGAIETEYEKLKRERNEKSA